MIIKELIEFYDLPEHYSKYNDSIDFEKIQEFSALIINGMIAKYGKPFIKREIEIDSSNSVINHLLTYIIEIGAIKMISDNQLYKLDYNEINNYVVSIGLALDAAISEELKNQKIHIGSSNFYNFETIDILLMRIIKHAQKGKLEFKDDFPRYATELIKINIFSKL